MRSILLTLIKCAFWVGLLLVLAHVVMTAFDINVDDVKDFFNDEEKSFVNVCYAAEKAPIEGENKDSLCLFYDGEELFKVEAVPLGTAFSAPKIEKEGYTFKGWQYNGNIISSSELTATAEIMFFYATWELNIYTVSYYDINGNLIGSYEASIHSDVTSFQAPEIENREFLGWYNAADAEAALSSDYKVTSDLVLIPQYSEVRATFFLLVLPELILEAELSAVITLLLLIAYAAVCLFVVFIICKGIFKGALFILAKLHRAYYSAVYNYVCKRIDQGKPVTDKQMLKAHYFIEFYKYDEDESDAASSEITESEVQP